MKAMLFIVQGESLKYSRKLKHHGILGKVNTCRIQNFLASRSQAVADEGEMSEYISVESGVSQGSVLGNSLFLF
jgi:hypothetical protein